MSVNFKKNVITLFLQRYVKVSLTSNKYVPSLDSRLMIVNSIGSLY